jgi:hypothetical protein
MVAPAGQRHDDRKELETSILLPQYNLGHFWQEEPLCDTS